MDWFLYDNGLRHERVKEKELVLLDWNLKKLFFMKSVPSKI